MREMKPVTHGESLHTRAVHQFVWTLCSYAPRQYVPKHDHARLGLTYLVDGSLQEGFSSRTFDAHAGHTIVKPPDAAHWDRAGSRGATCLVLEVADHPAMLLDLAPILDRLALCRAAFPRAQASEVVRHLRSPRAASAISLASLGVEFVAATQGSQGKIRSPPQWLGRVLDFIRDRFTNIRDIDEVATVAGVHPVHLARVFRAHLGCTLRTYLLRLRLESAAAQLRYSREPISRIAFGLGFADQSHLTRGFSMHFGVSPAQYRHIFLTGDIRIPKTFR